MSKSIQQGCKKCGAVLTVETRTNGLGIDVRVKEAKVNESRDGVEIQCKKCGKPVLVMSLRVV
jgi:hypothetical protein